MKNMMPRITLISDWSQESLAEYLGGTMTLPRGQNEQKRQKSSAYSDRMMVDWRSKSQSCSAKTVNGVLQRVAGGQAHPD